MCKINDANNKRLTIILEFPLKCLCSSYGRHDQSVSRCFTETQSDPWTSNRGRKNSLLTERNPAQDPDSYEGILLLIPGWVKEEEMGRQVRGKEGKRRGIATHENTIIMHKLLNKNWTVCKYGISNRERWRERAEERRGEEDVQPLKVCAFYCYYFNCKDPVRCLS